MQFLGTKTWNQVPNETKLSTNIHIFNNKIKNWIRNDCPCRLCKDYLAGVGYVHLG